MLFVLSTVYNIHNIIDCDASLRDVCGEDNLHPKVPTVS